MRTPRILLMTFITASLICGNALQAQTFHQELRASFTDIQAWCLWRNISGTFIYDITYHIDKKTGKIDRLHWVTSHSEIWDSETEEKYKIIMVGMDNGEGSQWEFWNNVNDYTQGYEIENGWLLVPDVFPDEGMAVLMNFKFIAKGGNLVGMKNLIILHRNAKGEITVDKTMSYADCN